MKTIIAGTRKITDPYLLDKIIKQSGFNITTVISGCAKGVDQLGETWADIHDVPVLRFQAQWKKFGRGAGPMRNMEMAENADACIVIWDGESNGTKNMISLAKKKGLMLHIHKIPVD